MSYKSTLEDSRAIYVPAWPVDIALENLAKAGKILGTEAVIAISELNTAAVIVAIMDSKDPSQTASLIKYFVTKARVDGKKIEGSDVDTFFEDNLYGVAEVFAHVVAAQYASFFVSGLAKAHSQSK